jgi:hypothetical protein
VHHTSETIVNHFDFIKVTRTGYKIQENYTNHLRIFLELAKKFKTPYKIISSFLASSILVDAFPPRMHRTFLGAWLDYLQLTCYRIFIKRSIRESLPRSVYKSS